jgi:hypothetical protein
VAERRRSRSWRIAGRVLIGVGLVAGVLGVVLFFSDIGFGGSDCGSVVSPKDPLPTDPDFAPGCPGTHLFRVLLVVWCGVLAVGCIVGGLVLRRRDRRAGPSAGGTAPE